MLYYLAYGSNLHPLRLQERDGSAKCDLLTTGNPDPQAFAALYTLATEHKNLLDEFEGVGHGYIDKPIDIIHANRPLSCFSYIAQQSHIVNNQQPYHWYKQLVILGAQYLNFPQHYIESIQAVESRNDDNTERIAQHNALIERMVSYRL